MTVPVNAFVTSAQSVTLVIPLELSVLKRIETSIIFKEFFEIRKRFSDYS